MYVITKQSLLASAATRYRDAHQRHGVWLPAAESSDAEKIHHPTDAVAVCLDCLAKAAQLAAAA